MVAQPHPGAATTKRRTGRWRQNLVCSHLPNLAASNRVVAAPQLDNTLVSSASPKTSHLQGSVGLGVHGWPFVGWRPQLHGHHVGRLPSLGRGEEESLFRGKRPASSCSSSSSSFPWTARSPPPRGSPCTADSQRARGDRVH